MDIFLFNALQRAVAEYNSECLKVLARAGPGNKQINSCAGFYLTSQKGNPKENADSVNDRKIRRTVHIITAFCFISITKISKYYTIMGKIKKKRIEYELEVLERVV